MVALCYVMSCFVKLSSKSRLDTFVVISWKRYHSGREIEGNHNGTETTDWANNGRMCETCHAGGIAKWSYNDTNGKRGKRAAMENVEREILNDNVTMILSIAWDAVSLCRNTEPALRDTKWSKIRPTDDFKNIIQQRKSIQRLFFPMSRPSSWEAKWKKKKNW